MHAPLSEEKTDDDRGSQDLLKELVEPGLLDASAQLTEDISEMRAQLRKQRARIAELRVKRDEDPGAYLILSCD